MWPWEHVAFGYVLYSTARRGTRGRAPSDAGAVAVATGAVAPDLIDKPLSWGLGLFSRGFAVGHSALVAGVACALTLFLAARRGHLEVGTALWAGYWSHLLGDALNPLRNGDPVAFERLLWPLVERPPYPTDRGLARGIHYLEEFLLGLPGATPTGAAVVYLLLPLPALVLWLADGRPGPRGVWRFVGRIRHR